LFLPISRFLKLNTNKQENKKQQQKQQKTIKYRNINIYKIYIYTMVSSKINKDINYVETKTIDPEDNGYNSSLYEIYIENKPVIIALGKQKYTFSSKSVLHYPIYLVVNQKIKAQIGVYEIQSSRSLNVLDNEGDIDLTKFGEPLLYSFVNSKFIDKILSIPVVADKPVEKKEKPEELIEVEDIDVDENDVMKLKIPQGEMSKELEKTVKISKDGIFEIDKHMKQPISLKEETDEDSNKKKMEFKKSAANKWIENFFKNNNYNIVPNDGGGDCFLYVIRDAFRQIGHNTTVPKLRALLAKELTDDVYQEQRNLYLGFQNEIREYENDIAEIKKTNAEYRKRMKKLEDKNDEERLIKETNKLADEYKKVFKKRKETLKLQEEYVGYMKDIDSIDKYRAYIQTSSFWADAWAISTLERLLNVKFIIFSEESFKSGDFDGVLNCGDFNKNLEELGTFSPNYYIMTVYSGNHYELLTYYHKRILNFNEIPYDVKVLGVNKCLEKNSGIYYLIQDFRNFKSKLGMEPDLGKKLEEEDEDSDLYDSKTTFMFHSKSDNSPKPGAGSGEKIPKTKVQEYVTLSKIDNWRKKLDDSWGEGIFELDKHKWMSVEHYIQAAKYKKGFPDFYLLFSLDSDSEISKDPSLAKIAGEGGKKNNKALRPKEVKTDADYHLGRFEEERERAVSAKFSQNEDLKQTLLSTNNALLLEFIRRNPAKKDIILMGVRRSIAGQRPNKD
jgi:predicted NAD-dependent protein-ADP-ribosyltransferase YbiA (DUF1768 family)